LSDVEQKLHDLSLPNSQLGKEECELGEELEEHEEDETDERLPDEREPDRPWRREPTLEADPDRAADRRDREEEREPRGEEEPVRERPAAKEARRRPGVVVPHAREARLEALVVGTPNLRSPSGLLDQGQPSPVLLEPAQPFLLAPHLLGD